jgi:hypothetical protein
MSTPAFAIGCPVENAGAIALSITACAPAMSAASRPTSSGAR